MAWAIQVMVREVAYWGATLTGDLQAAAKEFADNAGPVVDIITGGLEAITALRDFKGLDWTALETVLSNMSLLDRFLATLVADLAKVAGRVKADLQAAAKEFAENVSPVIDIITGGLEVITALRDFKGLDWTALDTVLSNMSLLDRFLATVVADLAKVAGRVKADLQTAAKEFAENVGPVIDIITGGLEAITALRDFKGLDWTALDTVLSNMSLSDRFLATLVADLAKVAGRVKADLQTAAKEFAENAGPVLDLVVSGLALINNLKEAEPPDMKAIGKVLDGVSDVITEITEQIADLQKTIVGDTLSGITSFADNVEKVLDGLKTALATLKTIGELEAPKVGLEWVTALKTSMGAAVPSLEAVLGKVVTAFRTAETGIGSQALTTGGLG